MHSAGGGLLALPGIPNHDVASLQIVAVGRRLLLLVPIAQQRLRHDYQRTPNVVLPCLEREDVS